MGFPTGKADSNGKDKKFGNPVPADENSNKGPGSSSTTVGLIKGRLSFSKQSITSLNTGEPGVEKSTQTTVPGKAV